jgi:hypothetical protein
MVANNKLPMNQGYSRDVRASLPHPIGEET